VPLPGRAQHAMRGQLPTGLPCTLAFCDDTAEMFSRGQRIAYTSERPLASDVVVAELHGTRPGLEDDVEAGRLPEGLEAQVHEGMLVVWRSVMGNLDRRGSDVDAFVAKADGLVQGAAAPEAAG